MQQGTESKPIIPTAAEICDINALSNVHSHFHVYMSILIISQ